MEGDKVKNKSVPVTQPVMRSIIKFPIFNKQAATQPTQEATPEQSDMETNYAGSHSAPKVMQHLHVVNRNQTEIQAMFKPTPLLRSNYGPFSHGKW